MTWCSSNINIIIIVIVIFIIIIVIIIVIIFITIITIVIIIITIIIIIAIVIIVVIIIVFVFVIIIVIVFIIIVVIIITCSFDILVNGGGAVTLSFERPPFLTKNLTVLVRWNRMTILDPVTLLLRGQSEATVDKDDECQHVDSGQSSLHPVVVTAAGKKVVQTDRGHQCPSCSFVTPESQVS